MILVGSYEIDFMVKNENLYKAADNRRLIAYETMRGKFHICREDILYQRKRVVYLAREMYLKKGS